MSLVGSVVRLRGLLEKTLLVSSKSGGPVARSLADAGCLFTRVRDGTAALYRMRHETFDTVVLVSTGKEMDLVETVLNLRDMRPSIPIIVLSDPTNPKRDPALEGIVSRAIPQLAILTLQEFQSRLDATEKQR